MIIQQSLFVVLTEIFASFSKHFDPLQPETFIKYKNTSLLLLKMPSLLKSDKFETPWTSLIFMHNI